jgi:hypothetical protein
VGPDVTSDQFASAHDTAIYRKNAWLSPPLSSTSKPMAKGLNLPANGCESRKTQRVGRPGSDPRNLSETRPLHRRVERAIEPTRPLLPRFVLLEPGNAMTNARQAARRATYSGVLGVSLAQVRTE